ncbi:MAG TPA: TetR/AcrR family transcriptional regulator, partial [Thiobacillus sp.]
MNVTAKTPDLTRQKLLEAAFEEIHRNGFQAASITQILADTGLTKGALYHHFPDKKALGLAVIEEVVRPALAAMMFAPLAETRQPLAALQALLAAKA